MILSGVLYNAGGPVRLAKIMFIATRTSLNGVLKGAYREFITQEDGTYFLDLEPGYYRVEWYPSKGPAVRLGTVTADEETMATLPAALGADGQPVNPDIVSDEVQEALNQIVSLRGEVEGLAQDAADSAASVDAENIVHAPGSGLENEAGTAYSRNAGKGATELPTNADLGDLAQIDTLSAAPVGDVTTLQTALGVVNVADRGVAGGDESSNLASQPYVDAGLADKVDVGQVGFESVDTSTGTQTVVEALDRRTIHVNNYEEMLGYQNVASDLAVFNLQGSYFKLSNGEFVRWVDPTEEKILYVSPAGSDSNTGFDSTSPKLTLQAAIDTLALFGPNLQGQWVIQLGAGTYSRGRFPDDGLRSELPIWIRGPEVGGHPNVPIAIVSEGATGTIAELIGFRADTQLLVQDVKFIGADGSRSSAGISGADAARVYTQNVHAENCYWGVSMQNRANMDIKGGIFQRCGFLNGNPSNGAGTRSLFNTRHAIGRQGAGNTDEGPWFLNCHTACFAQEGSTGHCDYARVEDCYIGLSASVNSRFNYGGTRFRRNVIDVRADYSHVTGANADYGTGDDASSARVITQNLGTTLGLGLITSQSYDGAAVDRRFASEIVSFSPSTTNAEVFKTYTCKGGFWSEPAVGPTYTTKALFFEVFASLAGSSGTKQFFLRADGGGVAGIAFPPELTGRAYIKAYVYFQGADQRLMLVGSCNGGTYSGVQTKSATLENDFDVTLECRKNDLADSVTIDFISSYISM